MLIQKKYHWVFMPVVSILIILVVFLFRSCNNRQNTKEINNPSSKVDSVNYPVTIKNTYVQAQMKNVNFHVDNEVVLEIIKLRGRLIPSRGFDHPVFNKKTSYQLEIYTGNILINMESLSSLLNKYVFNYKGSSLKNIKVSIFGENLKQEGLVHNIPFTMTSTITVTPEGKMKLHPVEIKAAGIEVEGLMKLLNIELKSLIASDPHHVISTAGNDLYLDPVLMLPPPKIRGHLKSVKLEDGKISMNFFSKSEPPLSPVVTKTNYMFFRGGYLTFGKLTMADADMQIIDLNPNNPFDFFLDHYFEQLVAGYHKTTIKDGLLIYMPDYSDIANHNRTSSK